MTTKMTPRKLAHRWMKRVSKGHWGLIYGLCQITWLNHMNENRTKEFVRGVFGLPVQKYKITKIREITPTHHIVDIDIDWGFEPEPEAFKISMSVICETAPYSPSVDGDWGISPISTIPFRP